MANCIFCKIAKGEIPSYKVYEDDLYLAFLTKEPFKEGHTLVVPKAHTDYLFDMGSVEIGNFMNAAKKVATKLKEVFKPKSNKIAVMVVGDEVPHVHIHLIPMDTAHDLTLAKAKSASQEQLQQAFEKINNIN